MKETHIHDDAKLDQTLENFFQRTSLGATLLSPVSQLALGTIGRSRSLINQSQESLDPGDHFDHSDREEEPHQQDADDEDESGLVSVHTCPEAASLSHDCVI